MKVRNGFVSNSSSSSFVIAHKKTNDMKVEVKPAFMKVFVQKQVDVMFENTTYGTIDADEHINEVFSEEWGKNWREESWLLAIEPKIKAALRKGYVVDLVEAEYGSNFEEIFHEVPDEDDGTGIYKIYSMGD